MKNCYANEGERVCTGDAPSPFAEEVAVVTAPKAQAKEQPTPWE